MVSLKMLRAILVVLCACGISTSSACTGVDMCDCTETDAGISEITCPLATEAGPIAWATKLTALAAVVTTKFPTLRLNGANIAAAELIPDGAGASLLFDELKIQSHNKLSIHQNAFAASFPITKILTLTDKSTLDTDTAAFIGKFEALEKLQFARVPVALSREFLTYPELKTLRISNGVTSIGPSSFASVPKIEQIILDDNPALKLADIVNDAFNDIPASAAVTITNSKQIARLPKEIFEAFLRRTTGTLTVGQTGAGNNPDFHLECNSAARWLCGVPNINTKLIGYKCKENPTSSIFEYCATAPTTCPNLVTCKCDTNPSTLDIKTITCPHTTDHVDIEWAKIFKEVTDAIPSGFVIPEFVVEGQNLGKFSTIPANAGKGLKFNDLRIRSRDTITIDPKAFPDTIGSTTALTFTDEAVLNPTTLKFINELQNLKTVVFERVKLSITTGYLKLANVESLSITSGLYHIGANAFSSKDLPKLKFLNLNNNPALTLQNIDDKAFHEVAKGATIDISENKGIDHLPRAKFHHATKISEAKFKVGGNNRPQYLTCDKRANWICKVDQTRVQNFICKEGSVVTDTVFAYYCPTIPPFCPESFQKNTKCSCEESVDEVMEIIRCPAETVPAEFAWATTLTAVRTAVQQSRIVVPVVHKLILDGTKLEGAKPIGANDGNGLKFESIEIISKNKISVAAQAFPDTVGITTTLSLSDKESIDDGTKSFIGELTVLESLHFKGVAVKLGDLTLPRAKVLVLDGVIEELGVGAFSRFPLLESIIIRNNPKLTVEKISDRAFEGVRSSVKIELTNQAGITKLPKEKFETLLQALGTGTLTVGPNELECNRAASWICEVRNFETKVVGYKCQSKTGYINIIDYCARRPAFCPDYNDNSLCSCHANTEEAVTAYRCPQRKFDTDIDWKKGFAEIVANIPAHGRIPRLDIYGDYITKATEIPADASATLKIDHIYIRGSNALTINFNAFPATYATTTELAIDGRPGLDYQTLIFINKFSRSLTKLQLTHIPVEVRRMFYLPKLTTLILDRDVESIDEYALSGVSGLQSLTDVQIIKNPRLRLEKISDRAFDRINVKAIITLVDNELITHLPESKFKRFLDTTQGKLIVGSSSEDTKYHLQCNGDALWICANAETYKTKLEGFKCKDNPYGDVFEFCESHVAPDPTTEEDDRSTTTTEDSTSSPTPADEDPEVTEPENSASAISISFIPLIIYVLKFALV